MSKKLLCLLMSVSLLASLTGCLKTTTSSDVWYDDVSTYTVPGESGSDGSGAASENNNNNNNNNNNKNKNNSNTSNNSSKDDITTSYRPTKKPGVSLGYKPIAESGANYNVKGEVTIAVNTLEAPDFEALFDTMEELYPNVKIKYDYYALNGDDPVMQYLTTRAATGTMADIIWYDRSVLPTKIMQGWVYPITELFNADPNKGNVSAKMVKDYTYCGELYALPTSCSFDCEIFNVDLLNKLGMKAPNTTWTMDDFEKYLRAAAAKYTSGLCVATENLGEVYTRYAWWSSMCANGRTDNRYGQWGFNYDTNQVESTHIIEGAKKQYYWTTMMPGVNASYESMQKDSSGKSRLEVNLGATSGLWEKGKVLIKSTNTGGANKIENDYNFNYKICPTPNTAGQVSMHVDCCYMTTAVKKDNVAAAYQLLRFMTFSDNGNLARLTMYEDSQKGKYTLNSRIYYPATTSKVVIDKFDSLSVTTDVDVYFVKNIPNASRFDVHKIVPNMYSTVGQIVNPYLNQVTSGQDDGSGMVEAIARWNAELKKQINNMNTEIKKVQQKFNATH